MNEVLAKILESAAVLFWSSVKFILGLVHATVLFDLGFIPSVLLTVAGGMAGVYFFAFLDRKLRAIWCRIFGKKVRKVRFSKFRRWMVHFKSKYGLAGIALLTPILFQVPIGTIMAMRLIKDLKKVSVYMLVSFTFFSLVFCGLYYGFDHQLRILLGNMFHHN